MNSREKILANIASNKPALVQAPELDLNQVIVYKNLIERFTNTLTSIGGMVIQLADDSQIKQTIAEEREAGNWIADTIWDESSIKENLRQLPPETLAKIEKTYIRGTLGVAENGAVWIYEQDMVHRLLPFICQHLVIVLSKSALVATMHHAYQHIDVKQTSFGVFIAGPSKTADIEQSLVIGAHGARSLVVYLVD